MKFEDEIAAWCYDYLGDKEKAESLTNIVMYHTRKQFKRRFRIGFIIGFITVIIALKWLS